MKDRVPLQSQGLICSNILAWMVQSLEIYLSGEKWVTFGKSNKTLIFI